MEERKKIIKIGVLAIFSFVVLYWGVNFLKGTNVLSKVHNFSAIYNKVDGLTASSVVTINGFKVGQVSQIYFLSDNTSRLMVKFIIGNQYKIPDNAIAYIYSSDIMGTKGIKLVYDADTVYYQDGDTLKSAIEGDLKDQVSVQMLPLKYKIESLLGSTDSVLAVVQNIFNEQTRENLSKSFESIKNTIKNLENTTFRLDSFAQNESSTLEDVMGNVESITANLKLNNDHITASLKNLESFTDSLANSDLKAAIDNANIAVAQLNSVLLKINEGEGTLSQLLNNDTLYTYITNVTLNLNKLIRDVKENPKRYVHFSAIDMGRTVLVVEKDKSSKKIKKAKAKKEEEE
ncbi:MAG: MCE family protein [Bacteroidales bacterium]|nr:MCE family protein [Bacteroidales bacterium]